MSLSVQTNADNMSASKTIFADTKAHKAICDTIASIMTRHGVMPTVSAGIVEELKAHLPAVITGFIPALVNKLKDPNAPKGPTGSYLQFANDTRAYYKNHYSTPEGKAELKALVEQLHIEAEASLPEEKKTQFVFTDTPAKIVQYIAKAQGYAWRHMTDDQKQPYIDRANQDKAEHDEKMKTYTPATLEQLLAAPINNKISRPRKPADPNKPKKDPNAPKMPKNTYLMWYDDIKTKPEWAAHKAHIDSLDGTSRVSAVAKLFKGATSDTYNCPQDWKKYYEDLRSALMIEYNKKKGQYAQTQTVTPVSVPHLSVSIGGHVIGVAPAYASPYDHKVDTDDVETQPVDEQEEQEEQEEQVEEPAAEQHVRVLPQFIASMATPSQPEYATMNLSQTPDTTTIPSAKQTLLEKMAAIKKKAGK